MGKNAKLMKVDNEFAELASSMAIKNKMSMREITKEIAQTMKKMNGKNVTREIKF